MCGRFSLTQPGQMMLRFGIESAAPSGARYNVAPAQQIPVIIAGADGPVLQMMRWGFEVEGVGPTPRPPLINARAETVAEKPLFRRAFAHTRCLIPADGFYEWQEVSGQRSKQPFYIHRRDETLFAFAGLYTAHAGRATVAIITTAPNAVVAPIHDRMPVILDADDDAFWLDPAVRAPEALLPLLRPSPEGELEAYPISSRISSVRNEGLEIVRPLVAPARTLFS